jgi:hypothetical protein
MAGHVACVTEKTIVKRTLVKEAGRKMLIRIPVRNLKGEIQRDLK